MSGEWLEAGRGTDREVAGNLRDMERFARWLGVGRRAVRFLRNLEVPSGRSARVLDLAAGSGWLSRRIVRELGPPIAVTAVDRDPRVLAVARGATPSEAPVRYVRGDALAPPFAAGPFDAAVCVMALHHFPADAAARLVAALDRLAPRRWIVCDLVGGPATRTLARAAARIASRNPLTRHDGPLSAGSAHPWPRWVALAATCPRPGLWVERFGGVCAALGRGP